METLTMETVKKSNKNFMVTLLLCFFLAPLGIHRFYVRKPWTGIFMLLTFGGLGIWALIDLIVIITGNFKDGDGIIIKN